MGDFKDWTDFVKTVGVPTTILFVFCFCFFRYIAIPIANAHITFVNQLPAQMQAMIETFHHQTESIEKMNDLQTQQAAIMDSQRNSTEKLANAVQSLACQGKRL